MTPALAEGSVGGVSSAPISTSEPRGSLQTAARKPSWPRLSTSTRSLSGPASAGPPSTTTRVGSPPVCESMTRMRCIGSVHQRRRARLDVAAVAAEPPGADRGVVVDRLAGAERGLRVDRALHRLGGVQLPFQRAVRLGAHLPAPARDRHLGRARRARHDLVLALAG